MRLLGVVASWAADHTPPDVRNDAVVALQEQIVAAQESYAALLENVRMLEAEARRLEIWESEKERYELKNVTEHSKILAYTLKGSEQGAEPPHWICPDCYSQAKKSLLQYAVRAPGRAEVLGGPKHSTLSPKDSFKSQLIDKGNPQESTRPRA